MKRILVLCSIVVVVVISVKFFIDTQKYEGTIVISTKPGEILGFHPKMEAFENPTFSFNANLFNCLITTDQYFRLIPALAKSWQNINRRTWRFYLRNDVQFHNGYSFTAEDVKFTYEYILDDETSILRDQLVTISSVEIVDDHTIDIITKKPNPTLLNKLSQVPIVSKRVISQSNNDWPIGTGAYKLVDFQPGKEIIIERNEDYWGKKPQFKRAVYKFIEDDRESINALLKGEVDFVGSITPKKYAELKEDRRANWILSPGSRVIYLSFDFRKENSYGFPGRENPVADLRVRQAIYHAIDEDKIIAEVMGGIVEPATQFINPYIYGYDHNIKRLPFDLKKARALMKEAGYEDGFEITLSGPNDRYIKDAEILREVARHLAKINIRVKVNALPKKDFFPLVQGKKVSFYLLGWICDTNDGGDIFDYLLRTVDEERSLGTYNAGYYSNPEVDRLSQESTQILDSAERLALMQEAFALAAADVAWVPLHIQKEIYGLSKRLKWTPRADEIIIIEEFQLK